jgi:hypothetical protein
VHTKALVGDEPGSRQALEREVGALVGSAKDLDQLTFLKSLLRKAYESIVAPRTHRAPQPLLRKTNRATAVPRHKHPYVLHQHPKNDPRK